MFMRLGIVFSLLVVQGALAQDASEFESQLSGYQNRLPRDCKLTSPAMKLIYACSQIEQPNANPRFYGVIEAGKPGSPTRSTNGVNFCYNTLVNVQRNGDQIRISALRDKGINPTRTVYTVNKSNLKSSGGEFLLPLENLEGQCFGYTDTIDAHCQGFFGGRTNNVPLTMRLDLNGNPRHVPTAERDVLGDARHNGSQLSPSTDVNRDEATRAAIAYARAQLVARATLNMNPNNASAQKVPPTPGTAANPDPGVSAYRNCDQMMINMENSLQPQPKANPDEDRTLAEYRRRINSPANNTAPASSGPANGVRERTPTAR